MKSCFKERMYQTKLCNINNAESISAKEGMLKKKTWLASMRTIMDHNNGQFLLARISVLILIFSWLESGKGFLKSFAHKFLFIGLHQWITPHTMYSAGVQVIQLPWSYCQSVIMWRTETHNKIQSIFWRFFFADRKRHLRNLWRKMLYHRK